MEEASPAGQVQGLCCHSPTAKEGPEEGARGPIPPTLSEGLSQATPSVKCSDLRGQAGGPVRCQREESASIFPGAAARLPFWVRDIRSLWIHPSSKDIQAVFERVSYNAFL